MPRKKDRQNVASCDNDNNSAAAQHRSKHTPQTWLMQLQEGQYVRRQRREAVASARVAAPSTATPAPYVKAATKAKRRKRQKDREYKQGSRANAAEEGASACKTLHTQQQRPLRSTASFDVRYTTADAGDAAESEQAAAEHTGDSGAQTGQINHG